MPPVRGSRRLGDGAAWPARLRTRRFRRGEVIFHAGDPGDSLSIVRGGSVKILVAPEDGSEPAILTTVGPGGFFGELALLDGGARSATAVAVEASETVVLHRDAFDRLLDENAAIRRALLSALAGEIRRLTAQLEDLHFLDLPGRLARHLLREIEAATSRRRPVRFACRGRTPRASWRA